MWFQFHLGGVARMQVMMEETGKSPMPVPLSYGSCRSLFGQRIGVGLPALVSLPGAVLVAAAP